MKNPHIKGKRLTPTKKTIRKQISKTKPLTPSQKKRDASIMKAEESRRPIDDPRGAKSREAGKKYYSDKKGFKGTAYGSNTSSKNYREKLADKKAADNKDAKRGGFLSANAMKSSSKKSNKKIADNKKRKADELTSRGRK